MSRTLADLTLGTTVNVFEIVNGVESPVEHYLLKKTSSNAILLRKTAVQAKRMHKSASANYPDSFNENEGTGAVCEMDKFLCSDYLNRFSQAMKNALSPENIKYYDLNAKYEVEPAVIEIPRRVFLLSRTEVGYSSSGIDEGDSMLAALQTATGLTGNNARKCYDGGGAAVGWWLRSAYSASNFRYVSTNGNGDNISATNTSIWLRPALSVALATLVTPEGSDIYLLPDPEKPYRELDGISIIGRTSKMPKKARLKCDIDGMYETTLWLSNNADDESPVWEEVTNGVEHTFVNASKTSAKWAIGFKFNGKSTSIGKIRNPNVVTIEEATNE